MVSFAPKDIQIQLRSGNGVLENLGIVTKNIEFATFFHFMDPSYMPIVEPATSHENMSLIVFANGETFEVPMPESGYDIYTRRIYRLYTLKLSDRSLTLGTSPVRNVVLFIIRMACTLVIEGLIFLVFGFRGKRNWIVFFVVNLITQGWLYIICSNPTAGGAPYWYLYLEFFIFVAEITAFCFLLREKGEKTHKRWWKPPLFALAANTASLFLGSFLVYASWAK